jgi:hypothetical protein
VSKTLKILLAVWAALAARRGLAFVNPGFETGNLTGWTSSGTGANPGAVNVVGPGCANSATYTNGSLSCVHAGNFAAELYSSAGPTAGDTGHADSAHLEQSDIVPAGKPALEFWYAAILNGAHFNGIPGSANSDDTYVQFTVKVGATVISQQTYNYGLNYYQLVDDCQAPAGSTTCSTGCINCYGWRHLPWTFGFFDLTAYVGQTVTIMADAYDCNYGGHFCFAYMDDVKWDVVPSPTYTDTPTSTISPTSSNTPVYTPTMTPTFSNSPTMTPTFSDSPTYTDSPTITPSFTSTETPTPTPTRTITQTFTNSPTFTDSPTITPTFTPDYFHGDLQIIAVYPHPLGPQGGTFLWGVPYAGVLTLTLYNVRGEVVWKQDAPCAKDDVYFPVNWNGQTSAGVSASFGEYYLMGRLNGYSRRSSSTGRWLSIVR